MKKLISAIGLLANVLAYSQITVGVRANALFNTSSAKWTDFKDNLDTTIDRSGDNASGFNVGLAFKVDMPISGWFVMPEVYYTSFKNKNKVGDVVLEAKSDRLDVPVMVGHNFILGKLAAFAGPVLSYNLSANKEYSDFKEEAQNEFTVGYQFGAQATLKKFVINARYEGAFSKDSRKFINTVAGADKEIRYDNRPSMFLLGLGYNFK